MPKKTRELKWKKTVVVEENEGNQLCLACGNAFDVIAPCSPYPIGQHGFCPHCGSEIVCRIYLEKDESMQDWVVEVTS